MVFFFSQVLKVFYVWYNLVTVYVQGLLCKMLSIQDFIHICIIRLHASIVLPYTFMTKEPKSFSQTFFFFFFFTRSDGVNVSALKLVQLMVVPIWLSPVYHVFTAI